MILSNVITLPLYQLKIIASILLDFSTTQSYTFTKYWNLTFDQQKKYRYNKYLGNINNFTKI